MADPGLYIWMETREEHRSHEEPMKTNDESTRLKCVASCSSTYSGGSFPAWRAFDLSETTACWASNNSATAPWLQLIFAEPMYDITVTITNRGDNATINGVISGKIYGWNTEEGETYETVQETPLITFSDRNATTSRHSTEHKLEGTKNHPCNAIRLKVDTWKKTSKYGYAAVGELKITGYLIPSDGGWTKVC